MTNLKPYPRAFARTRTKGGVPPLSVVKETSYPIGGNPISSQWNVEGAGQWEVMSDVVDPAFEKNRGTGKVFFNPMDQAIRSQTGAGSGYRIRITTGTQMGAVYDATGPWVTYLARNTWTSMVQSGGMLKPMLEGTWSDPRLLRAIAEASTMARRPPSDAHLLVAAAEWRKTVELLPGILHGWRSVFSRINAREAAFSKKRVASRPKDAVRNVKDIDQALNDTYLAIRYGMRPLVYDTVGALKAVQRNRSLSHVRQTQRGSASYNDNQSLSAVASFGILRVPLLAQSQHIVSVRAMNLWEANLGLLDDLGVSLVNIPEAVIDLWKFSFVYNWVVNINDFASALAAAAHPAFASIGACHVIRREADTTVTLTGQQTITNTTNYALERGVDGHLVVSTRLTRRVVGIPQPSLVLRASPLRWKDDLRLLDAIALLRQQLRGKGVLRLLASANKTRGV